jgi:hypothetical protein
MIVARTLAQVIGVERKTRQADNDAGKQARKNLTEARVTGQLVEYKPDVADEELPPSARSTSQYQIVQSKVTEELDTARRYSEEAINVVATKDATNMFASADIIVDGTVLQAGVGISHLLWLEGYLTEWRGFIAGLPTLSSTRRWTPVSTEQGLWVADPEEVPKTSKETVPLILHPGNDKHPPQVTTIQKDVRTGRTVKTAHSGAIPGQRKQELLDNCDKLIRAVRDAIARANLTTATEVTGEGAAIMDYLLG